VSTATSVRALLRAVRNAPVAASVGWRHLERDRWHTMLLALRTLPPATRRRIADSLSRRSPSTLAGLALAADGRHEDAARILDDAARNAGSRRLRALIAAYAALDAPREAAVLLERLPGDNPRRLRLDALVAARAGDLTHAMQAAGRAGWRAARLRRRLAAELTALTTQTGWAGRAASPLLAVQADRVLHLVTNALPDVTAGYTVRTQGIAAAQRRIGLDAQVASRLGFPVTVGHITAARLVHVGQVPYHRILPVSWLPVAEDSALWCDVEETARLVERLRPAVLHAHSKYRNAQVALALRDRFGLPVVYEVRGFLEETWRSRGRDPDTDAYRLARAAETRCMSAADVVVTLSESMKAEIVERGVDADHVVIVPNAVDDTFLAAPPDASQLRLRLGIEPDEVVVGTVTTVNDYEGLDALVDAVAMVRDRGAKARLLVVGSGPALSALRQRAADLGLGDSAVFTGVVPFSEVRGYHAAIDVFAVPRADTPVTRLVTPLKPLEAMATGRPVVASNVAPLQEIVSPGLTGVIARAGDPESLAATIEPLLSDSEERERMGGAARRWVAEHRTWDTAARAYRDLYDRLRHK
jgi:glycosyltransferase involved in cell wall biosynthesis